ncbi:MAG: hypothetical protein IJT72_10145 [Lachnospiraceae bacterium]|nr:hypothetical protein [Lachnospiraceae bacterium]
MHGNIILDGRRIKAMEALYALCKYTGKPDEFASNLWSELLKDEGLMMEFMYYLDNHTFKDDYKYKEYGLTDIYFYNLRVAEINWDLGKDYPSGNEWDGNKETIVLDTFDMMIRLKKEPEKYLKLLLENPGQDRYI